MVAWDEQTATQDPLSVASSQSYAGITSSGGVILFGAHCCGGDVNSDGQAVYLSSRVVGIVVTSGAVF